MTALPPIATLGTFPNGDEAEAFAESYKPPTPRHGVQYRHHDDGTTSVVLVRFEDNTGEIGSSRPRRSR